MLVSAAVGCMAKLGLPGDTSLQQSYFDGFCYLGALLALT